MQEQSDERVFPPVRGGTFSMRVCAVCWYSWEIPNGTKRAGFRMHYCKKCGNEDHERFGTIENTYPLRPLDEQGKGGRR